MNAAIGCVVRPVSALQKIDEVVDGRVEDFEIAAKVEAEDTGVLEEPFLGLLRIFRVTKGVRDNERGDAVRVEQAKQ